MKQTNIEGESRLNGHGPALKSISILISFSSPTTPTQQLKRASISGFRPNQLSLHWQFGRSCHFNLPTTFAIDLGNYVC